MIKSKLFNLSLRKKIILVTTVSSVMLAAMLWNGSSPPSLPLGLNLRGAVELQVEDLDSISVLDLKANNCLTEKGSQILLLADDVMTVKDLIVNSLVSFDSDSELKLLYFTIDPELSLDNAGRKLVGDSAYFRVSKPLKSLVPEYAVSVIDDNYLLRPGQVLYVSLSDDVEYCQVSKLENFQINYSGFTLSFLEGDLLDFYDDNDSVSKLEVVNLWRTNLSSSLEIDVDDYSNLSAGFYWVETQYVLSQEQAVAELASLENNSIVQNSGAVASQNSGAVNDSVPTNNSTNDSTDNLERASDSNTGDVPVENPNPETEPVVEPESTPDPTPDPAPAADTDSDGFADDEDDCPSVPGTLNGCPDEDGDLIADADDNCPELFNPSQGNTDGDQFGDVCDSLIDSDGDLIADADDNCPDVANADQANLDEDEFGDACDPEVFIDTDGDGIQDSDDNCPSVSGTLNGCPDADGDLVADGEDDCPSVSGTLNGCPDADGDLVADAEDDCPSVPGTLNGCPDEDGDLVADVLDNCPEVFNLEQNNFDEDEIGDACDPDVDGDGVEDFNQDTGKMQDLCLFTSQGVASDELTGFGCVDGDGDNVLDVRDDNRILFTEFLSRNLIVDNCVDLDNENQLDYDNDGLGDACDNQNDLDFYAMVTKIIDPDNCGVEDLVQRNYLKDDTRDFERFPVRLALLNSHSRFLNSFIMYDRESSEQFFLENQGRILPESFWLPNTLYEGDVLESVRNNVEAVWSSPKLIKWMDDIDFDIGALKVGTGNVSSLIYRDKNEPLWYDDLFYKYLNTSKDFKNSYTSQQPSDWALEVETSEESMPLNPKVTDFLPEFEGALPLLYTNDPMFRTELKNLLDNIGLAQNQFNNVQNYMLSPLLELQTFPAEMNQQPFLAYGGCSKRPQTSDLNKFKIYGQNSSNFDHMEMIFDVFDSSKFNTERQRMRFTDFGFSGSVGPIFQRQTANRNNLEQLAFEFFTGLELENESAQALIYRVTTADTYVDILTRAFVRGCGDQSLRSSIAGSYDPRIFLPDQQDGWNLLIKDTDFNEFDWEVDSMPENIGVCPDGVAGCDFVPEHTCSDQSLRPYVVMLKDLVAPMRTGLDENYNVNGAPCLIPDPNKPKANLAVTDALETLAEDFELDVISSDDYSTPSRLTYDSSQNPFYSFSPMFSDWFGEVDPASFNELINVLNISNGNKNTFYGVDSFETQAELNSPWVDLAVQVRQNLMCNAADVTTATGGSGLDDSSSNPFMANKFWQPNASSLGKQSTMALLELEDAVDNNSITSASNARLVAEKFLKIFATGFWEEKWSQADPNNIRRPAEGHFGLLEMISANYASAKGYLVLATKNYKFWNMLPSFRNVVAGDNLRFEPSNYSLENQMAEYLLVQHKQGPILSFPYRYQGPQDFAPDDIHEVFNFYTQVLDDQQGTWLNKIMNFEYGLAKGEPYAFNLPDVDDKSPNSYVLAREYDHAIVIKNNSTRNIVIKSSALPSNQKWVRMVGMPIVLLNQNNAGVSQLVCPAGQKQNLGYMQKCAEVFAETGNFKAPQNPYCYAACESHEQYVTTVLDTSEFEGVEDDLHETTLLMEINRDMNLAAGQSVVLFDASKFNFDNLRALEHFEDPIKNSEFCNSVIPFSPVDQGTTFDDFVSDANNFKNLLCGDLFDMDRDSLHTFEILGASNVTNTCADATYMDFKCLLENVFEMDDEYFKQLELERLGEFGNE